MKWHLRRFFNRCRIKKKSPDVQRTATAWLAKLI